MVTNGTRPGDCPPLSNDYAASQNFASVLCAYLENHREEYYERLLAVSRDNDWTGWCAFFLRVIQIQAEENLAKAQALAIAKGE